MSDIRIPSSLTIPNALPQFYSTPALFIVTGRQEGVLYKAYRGTITCLAQYKIPTPHYSDNEGTFKTRSEAGISSSGAPKDFPPQYMVRQFVQGLRKILQASIKADEYGRIYIFTPSHIKRHIQDSLPVNYKKRVAHFFDGLYIKQTPLELIEKIAATSSHATSPANPEAEHILETSAQARTVVGQ
jgi:hypothetical protein